MAEADAMRRVHVLDGEAAAGHAAPARTGAFALWRAPFAVRHVLRLTAEEAERRGRVSGFDVSQPVNVARGIETLSTETPRASLRLGPDEWLLVGALAEEGDGAGLKLADVSHRNVALEAGGSAVRDVLATGIALDLDPAAFPVGAATRTLFAKAEIVIARCPDAGREARFRLECGRSFARYLAAHLGQSAELLGHAPKRDG